MLRRVTALTFLFGILLSLAAITSQAQCSNAPSAFRHPGILHTKESLLFIRTQVAAKQEPWLSAFRSFTNHPQSQATWKLRGPFVTVSRDNPPLRIGDIEMAQDANAAYQNALLWCLTDNPAHARKAIQILNAWASTCTAIGGHDRQLAAGLNGFKLVNAAELIRHTSTLWKPAEIATFERFVNTVVKPPLINFAPFANGNWDAACLKTLLAISVFCEDRPLFERACAYYRSGSGNGRLTHYVINETGQCQESGRDQGHTQLGLGLLAEACEVAWNQGVDLYGEADNRLLKGFEYTARYNLGSTVPFVPHVDTTGRYRHTKIAADERGKLSPIYELVVNHYCGRRHLQAPYSVAAVAKLRPEGPAFHCDHVGFGTLLFSQLATLPQNTKQK